jgi:hypothetical protein
MASNLLNPMRAFLKTIGDLNENRSRHTVLCGTRTGCRGLQPRIVDNANIAEHSAGRNAVPVEFVLLFDHDDARAGHQFIEFLEHGARHAAVDFVQFERHAADHAAIDDPGYQLFDIEHAEQGQVSRLRGLQTGTRAG